MAGARLLLAALLVATTVLAVQGAPAVQTRDDAMNYLHLFGYMADSSGTSDEAIRKAICDFQYMANINQTCELDDDTMRMMNMRRCGMPDNVGHSMDARRKRRYDLTGYRWRKTDLTYSIDNYTPDIQSTTAVDETIAAAFKVWSDVTPLTFTRVGQGADIAISFAAGDHEPGGTNPFDGPNMVLAHAFFPEFGDAHFDEDEYWTIRSSQGVNLLQVAAHEFGHSLGLGHSTEEDALMAPYYRAYDPDFKLHTDDIQGIRAIYGEGVGEPNLASCTGRVDAIARTADNFTYIFEGDRVWKRGPNKAYVEPGYPRPIGDVFQGLPNNIDAAIYYASSGYTCFFKGSQYWWFYNEAAYVRNPGYISLDFPGLPDNLDAAFTWSGNGRVYFVKGSVYYRQSRGLPFAVDWNYPRPLSVWKIPGDQVSAVYHSLNSQTYFFTPEGKYYQFDDNQFDVASGYPQSAAAYWQGCTGALEAAGTTPALNGGQRQAAAGLVPRLLVSIASAVLAAVYM